MVTKYLYKFTYEQMNDIIVNIIDLDLDPKNQAELMQLIFKGYTKKEGGDNDN